MQQFPFRNNRGISLISVIAVSVILAIVLMGALSLMSTLFKGVKRSELRGDLVSVRESLRQAIDCEQTWAASVPSYATDCFPSATAHPITLKDKNGNNITTGLQPVTGTWDPDAANFQGSTTYGDWSLKVYCDNTTMSFGVKLAKAGPSNGFATDPVTKRDFSWDNKTINPLFGSATSKICSYKWPAGGTAAPKKVIICTKTNYIPGFCGFMGPCSTPFSFTYTAAECGGTLPDTNYVGMLAATEVCGIEDSVSVTQPGAGGPGINGWYLGTCFAPANPSNLQVVFVRKDY